MTLLNETNRMLGCYPYRECKRISEVSGVNFHWLAKFRDNKIPDPGVKKVQKLHDALVLMKSESNIEKAEPDP